MVKTRVLIVDDEPNIRDLLATSLRFAGYEIQTAANGAQAVSAVTESEPDIILLDVMLPDVSGFDILQRVRGHAALKHIPIIMLTGKATREDVMFALSAGANGYITKPFEFESLTTSIRAVLGLGDEN